MGTTQASDLEVIESNKEESAQEYFSELENKLMSEETRSKPIGEVEHSLYSDIMELGRRMIQEHIDARGDGKVAESIIREDDKKLSHKRLLKRHLETLFGEVETERVGYSQRGESSIFPKDEQMALSGKLYSYPVQQKVCREALRSSYDEINETLSEYTGARVPKRQSLESVGNGAEDFEAFYLQRSSKEEEVQGKILVYSGDGKGVPMRCVQQRLVCSAGASPVRVEAGSPVAWIAELRETKTLKPIDKAIFGMVSELSGRNESECRGGLEMRISGSRAFSIGVKAA